jgi:thymidylate synthase
VTIVISEPSSDDLMRQALEVLLETGERILPTKGPARELQALTLELRNPRARLSRSETRGRLFSCLGELCWYLSKSNSLDSIAYYIQGYHKFAEGGGIHGAYGPRLFNFDGINQVEYVVQTLRKKPDSRQAVIQLFDHEDVVASHKDVPCTCTLQFMIRSGALKLITYMRSNDAYLGLPHDIFAFTMLQELIAQSIDIPMGDYVHVVGSFHLYETDVEEARAFLNEGWQSSMAMPAMPNGDPWPAVDRLVGLGEELRAGAEPLTVEIDDDPYWGDLSRILVILALLKADRLNDIAVVRDALHSSFYDIYIGDKVNRHGR